MDLPITRRFGIPITCSIRELQRDYRRILNYVKREKHPLLILRHTKAEAILIDVGTWEEMNTFIRNHIQNCPDTISEQFN